MLSLTLSGATPGTGLRSEKAADFHPDGSYFASSGEPFGARRIDLSFGPVRMRLTDLSESQAARLSERYRPFVTAPGEGPCLSITLRQAPVAAFLRARRDGASEIYRMERRVAGGRLILWSYEFAGWADAASRQARLDLVEPDGAFFDRGLENFLRVMTACSILHAGGFLLHGAAVVRGGRAYVFFGPSGAGKTTITRLSSGDTILSDDLTLVVPVDGGYAAAGIPFGMAHHRVPDTAGAFPIASFNRLVQSRSVGREPVAPARAVAEITASLPFVMQEARQAARAVENVGRVARVVPAYHLRFRKDATFWSVVEDAGLGSACAGDA